MPVNVWKIIFVDLLICPDDQKKSLGPFQKSETALSGNVLMLSPHSPGLYCPIRENVRHD